MMELTKRSPFSKKYNTMLLPMGVDEYYARKARWQAGELIQGAFDNLNADQREFIRSGITKEEWTEMFGKEDV